METTEPAPQPRRLRASVLLAAAVIAVSLMWLAVSSGPAQAVRVPPQGPSLAPGQCYTFPQIPGHVISTICRNPSP